MSEFDDIKPGWVGLLAGRRPETCQLQMEAVLESQSDSRGGCLPFKALGSDGRVYWIKMLENGQSPRVPVTEQIVSQCSSLIDAPVCETSLISIPADFDGDVLDNGTVIRGGVAHASLDLGNCSFDKWYEPQHRLRDDNRRRHVGYFAMFDWCWGNDMQWLYDLTDDWKTYSHDHGHFLPDSPDWTTASLEKSVHIAHEIGTDGENLDDNELQRVIRRLDQVSRDELAQILSRIPVGWPVTDSELETVGWFLEVRSTDVATRLRQLASRSLQSNEGPRENQEPGQ